MAGSGSGRHPAPTSIMATEVVESAEAGWGSPQRILAVHRIYQRLYT